MSPVTVAVLAYDRISPFHLSVPCLIFGEARDGLPEFRFKVCGETRGLLTTTAGFHVDIRHGLSALKQADIVIVPSWRDPSERAPEAILNSLVTAHRRGAQIVGLCLGAYVLAQAGLLDHRQATTHWAYAQDFKQRYPSIEVNADVLYIDHGDVLTSAGTAAAIDCCLHILRKRYGSLCANSMARRLVIAPHRNGGQAQFIEQPVALTTQGTRLGNLLTWAQSHIDHAHSVDSLAKRALMSRRTFTRQFRLATGMTLTAWLQRARLARAQHLLEASKHSIDMVAMKSGFGSVEALRLSFKREFGVSPGVWRKTFST